MNCHTHVTFPTIHGLISIFSSTKLEPLLLKLLMWYYCNTEDLLIFRLKLSSVPFFFHSSCWFIKVNDLFTLSLSHLFQILVSKMFPYKSITLNHSLSNLIISSQRLVTMSASLCTQTVLRCLIIQVLNIKSLLPKCLIQSLSLL